MPPVSVPSSTSIPPLLYPPVSNCILLPAHVTSGISGKSPESQSHSENLLTFELVALRLDFLNKKCFLGLTRSCHWFTPVSSLLSTGLWYGMWNTEELRKEQENIPWKKKENKKKERWRREVEKPKRQERTVKEFVGKENTHSAVRNYF